MISSKYITKIALVLMAAAVSFCLAVMLFPQKFSSLMDENAVYDMEYTTALFDTSEVMDINIIMEDASWQDMLKNATKEAYYQCDVVINGTTFHSVGIRPKGNTSLSAIASDPDNDRYSFKLEFDHFVEGQTCFGLDKLVLNNSYADATNMKEAIIYDMFQYIGADASLYNYAKISVNDSYWGVYLALEAVEESFLLRNYGTENGKLYKPDSMDFGGGMPEGEMPDFGGRPEGEMPDFGGMPEGEMPDFGGRPDRNEGFGGMGGNGGANLNYSDDALESYSAIWSGAVNASDDADHRRVVAALKNVSEGTAAETYLDVDNLLKYMAVHTFAVNDDSLSGGMAHNYYLYEANGKLNILPWDYNLSFGGMGSGNASDVVNAAIDDPFRSTDLFDIFLENEGYLAKYHTYYNQLVEEYIYSGSFEETYNRIRNQIDALVEADPNAMYAYEEYTAAAQMLYDIVMLRAESIRGQLAGTIPSTSEGQRENTLIDASDIDISAMGQFMGGGRAMAEPDKIRFENMPPDRDRAIEKRSK